MIIVIIALGYSPYMVIYYMIIVIIALGYSPYMVIYYMIIVIIALGYSPYLIVIPWARVVCLIYTPETRGPQA